MRAHEALKVITVLASTLEHLHEAGLYHGDIKPSNIGFTADGTPKFLDFGLSRAISGAPASSISNQLDGRARVEGTLAYLSPEVRDGAPPGPALDLWALSIVLCECLTGEHPFPTATTNAQIASRGEQAMQRVRLSAPPELCALLTRALSPGTERYPQTAGDLVKELARVNARHDSDEENRS
jgi:serine/threonine protein kinase